MTPSRMILATSLALSALPALAQTAAPAAPEPAYTLTANVGLFSDYRFRGISQTNKNPSLQGGFDFAHKSGIYLGNWNSNVDSALYTGANIEMDFYGGYKASFGDFGLDVGGLYYYYPGSGANGLTKIDNFELYVGGSWGPLTARFSYPVTDFFGATDSKGSYYVNVGGTFDLGSNFALVGAIGYQKLKGGAALAEFDGSTPGSYIDYKIGATYTLDSFVLGASYITTNRDYPGATSASKNISNGTVVVSVSKSF